MLMIFTVTPEFHEKLKGHYNKNSVIIYSLILTPYAVKFSIESERDYE